MPITFSRLRRLALLPALALYSACDNSVSIDPDVLAKGGSLTINIAADSSITGTLVLPAGVPGGQAGTADMKGRIFRRSDGTFQFDQVENTFVESLVWQQFTDALVSTSLLINTQFQITIRK